MRRTIGVFAVLALLGIACSGSGDGPAAVPGCEGTGVISAGEAVPACSFEGMPGFDNVSVDGLLGKPMVLNFWASWCTFCIREMPDFQAVWEQVSDRVSIVGLDVLGIQGETRSAAEVFRERTGAAYLMVFDPEGAFYRRFQPNVLRPVMPITIFADANGVVKEKFFGPLTEDQLRGKLLEHFGLSV